MKLQDRYIKIAREFAEKYKSYDNVLGATLNGGISRGTEDIYSEIDLIMYVKNKKAKNLPPKMHPKYNDLEVNGVWFHIHLVGYNEMLKKEWTMDERWDVKNSKIIFEKGKKISHLYKKKVIFYPEEKKKLRERYGFYMHWSLSLAEIFYKSKERKDLANGHLLVNYSMDNLINYYFLKNNEFVPYFKWKYYYFSRLKNPDKKTGKQIIDNFKIKDYSEKELKKRIRVIKKIIEKELHQKFWDYHEQNLKAVNNFHDSIKKQTKFRRVRW